jgi:hypothetical protein
MTIPTPTDEAGILAHARAVAGEIADRETAGTLLALAAQNERLTRKVDALAAVAQWGRHLAAERDAARAWARRWKRAAKWERNAALDARRAALATLATGEKS